MTSNSSLSRATELTTVSPSIQQLGTGLKRPECVLCLKSGDVFVSHNGGGILHINPADQQRIIGEGMRIPGGPFIPNGFAYLQDGSFLIANMGEAGGVWRCTRKGELTPYLVELNGSRLGATNFVMLDNSERIWITVTTRRWPISQAFTAHHTDDVADGYIILVDRQGPRMVADGLAFANEARIDPSESYLYLAETFARRILRFRLQKDGLGPREVFASFDDATFPDGIAFDSEGHLWIASIISNRVLRVAPDRSTQIMLADENAEYLANVLNKLSLRTLSRDEVQHSPGQLLKNASSIAFGGRDLRRVHIGSLGGDTLITFESPVAGAPLAHWHYTV